jgi:hypothetical protein
VVEVRRGQHVHATDGSAVTWIEDGIRLNITRQQVQDLPPVDIEHPNG